MWTTQELFKRTVSVWQTSDYYHYFLEVKIHLSILNLSDTRAAFQIEALTLSNLAMESRLNLQESAHTCSKEAFSSRGAQLC